MGPREGWFVGPLVGDTEGPREGVLEGDSL